MSTATIEVSVLDKVELALEVCRRHHVTPTSFCMSTSNFMSKVTVEEADFRRCFHGQQVERKQNSGGDYYVYLGQIEGVAMEWWDRRIPISAVEQTEKVTIE